MSSFMVKNESIGVISVYLESLYKDGYTRFKQCFDEHQLEVLKEKCKEVATSKEIDTEDYFNKHNLFKVLYHLNQWALNERYESDIREAPAYDNFKNWMEIAKDKYQLYKTIRCYLYQCSEGKAYKSDLFNCLDEVSNELAIKIIQDTKEYENAMWC